MEEASAVSFPLKCSVCSSKGVKSAIVITDPESGEVICSNCGMVISQNTEDNTRPEWRSFDGEGGEWNNNRSRIGTLLNTGVNRTQTDIADAAGITEVTLRNRYKDLKDKLPQLNN
jgi:transcription initiation factor TFIIIB Brf1 subunit/transcription initiation factor TFIIB